MPTRQSGRSFWIICFRRSDITVPFRGSSVGQGQHCSAFPSREKHLCEVWKVGERVALPSREQRQLTRGRCVTHSAVRAVVSASLGGPLGTPQSPGSLPIVLGTALLGETLNAVRPKF